MSKARCELEGQPSYELEGQLAAGRLTPAPARRVTRDFTAIRRVMMASGIEGNAESDAWAVMTDGL